MMNKMFLPILALLSSYTHAEGLLDIYNLAKQKDPQLLESKAMRDQLFEKINEEQASFLPKINLGLSANYVYDNLDMQTGSATNSAINLEQSLYNSANWINLDLAAKNATLSDVSYVLEHQNLVLRTIQTYFNVLQAEDSLIYSQATKKAIQRQLAQTQQRFEVGLAAITDVHEAEAAFDQSFADEIYAENTLENSYEALRELTGLEHRKLNKLDTERFSPQKTLWKIDKWTDAAIEKNLALHQARIKKELAKMQIDLSKSGHKPLVDLTMGLSSTYNNYKDNTVNTDGYSNQGDIGIKFSLPLYTGGATASQVKQSSFDYVAASEQLEKSYRSVMSAVKSSYNNVNASIGSVRAYQQAVVSAESALKATEAGYEVGTRTIIDVLDANRKLYDAKTKLAISRYSYIVNVATLKLNSGSLGKKEIIDIDNGLVNLR